MKHDISFLQKCTAVTIQCHSLRFSKKLPKSAMVELRNRPGANGQPFTIFAGEGEQNAEEAGLTPQEIPEGATIGVQSEITRIRGSKKLLDCDEAAAIAAEFTRVKNFVKDLSLPTPFGDGIFFVPNTLIEQVDAELRMSESVNIPHLVRAFVARYDAILEAERAALKENFHLSDYDSPQEILNRVRMDYAYVTFGIPENLPEVIRQREAEKQGQRLTEAIDDMQNLLRSEMAKVVQHAITRLTGTEEKNGKVRRLTFKDSLLGNIRDFLNTFRDRNITDDNEMRALCERAEQLLNGVDPQDLRDSDAKRDQIASQFIDIKAALDTMMVPRGNRVIQFDDEPEDDPTAGRPITNHTMADVLSRTPEMRESAEAEAVTA